MANGKWKRSISEGLYWRLKDDREAGTVTLRLVGIDGKAVDNGDILTVDNKTGLVRLVHDVDPSFGFKLKGSRVKVRMRP